MPSLLFLPSPPVPVMFSWPLPLALRWLLNCMLTPVLLLLVPLPLPSPVMTRSPPPVLRLAPNR